MTEPVAAPTTASRLRWGIIVLGVCLVVALVATWPLALHLTTDITLGNEQGAMVGLLSIWSLWWTANRLLHGFAGYWDAPFFYPNPGVFTYSEPEPLTGLLVAPLWGLGATPALVHNVALLLILTLNGVFAYRVARALDVPRLAALLGGVAMVALPFIAKVYGVLNLTPVFGLLWTLDGLVRFGRTGRLRDGVWAGLGFIACYLTCQQYALIFAPFALAAGIVALAAQGYSRRAVAKLIGIGLGTGLVLLPIILPTYQLHKELGFARQDLVVEALSAQPGDFLSRPNTASLPFPPRLLDDTAGLFPGILVLGLAILGLWLWWRTEAQRRWAIYLAASIATAVVLAMGLRFSILGWSPFDTLRTFVPGYAELRSPFRFAIVMQVMLVILATIGLAQLAAHLRKAAPALLITLGLLMAAENLNVPVPLLSIPTSPQTAWADWLKAQPQGTVVAHIPFPKGLRITDYEIEGWRMFAQIDHQQPIVNGYSGYFPPSYTDFQLAIAQSFPSTDLICELNLGLGAQLLVVDKTWLTLHQTDLAKFATYLQPAYQDDSVQIYRLSVPADACQSK